MPAAASLLPAPWLLAHAAHLSPNHAILAASLGLCLIILELNRPGMILPGACGLSFCLFAAASLSRYPVRWAALVLLLCALAVLIADLWRPVPIWLSGCALALLGWGIRLLIAGKSTISWSTALTCGLGIGLLTTALSRIARRARRLKAVH